MYLFSLKYQYNNHTAVVGWVNPFIIFIHLKNILNKNSFNFKHGNIDAKHLLSRDDHYFQWQIIVKF